MVDQIFKDDAGFRQDERLGVRVRPARDADDGGFAQRVDLFELRGGETALLPFEGLEVVGLVELF